MLGSARGAVALDVLRLYCGAFVLRGGLARLGAAVADFVPAQGATEALVAAGFRVETARENLRAGVA